MVASRRDLQIRKLSHQSSSLPSVVGRALRINQVVLTTAGGSGYVASRWMMHLEVIAQVRCLVDSFLWAGSDGSWDTQARVAWHTLILPSEDGGLCIIDPEMQSRALISKCTNRGPCLGNEP